MNKGKMKTKIFLLAAICILGSGAAVVYSCFVTVEIFYVSVEPVFSIAVIFAVCLFILNRWLKTYYLMNLRDPKKYTKANRRRNFKWNRRHNLTVDYTAEYFAGRFDECILHAKQCIDERNTTSGITPYWYLCEALFLKGEIKDCMVYMEEAEWDWESTKPFPFQNDFRYIRSYYYGKYAEAIQSIEKTVNNKSAELKRVKTYYLMGLAYSHLDDRESQAKCMQQILKLDQKTYFAQMARRFMEEYGEYPA